MSGSFLPAHCFFFVVHNERPPDVRSSSGLPRANQAELKVYALLPRNLPPYEKLRQLLVEDGIKIIDDGPFDALKTAFKSQRVEIVDILLDVKYTLCLGSLSVKVSSFNEAFLRFLLKRYHVVDTWEGAAVPPSLYRSTVLDAQTLNTMKVLLSFNANIQHRNEDGGTLLHYAAQSKHEGLIRLLLASGASVNTRSICCLTPLHQAVLTPEMSVATLELLIQSGAEVNATTKSSKYRDATPLHLALHKGKRADLVKTLLRNGAHVEANCSLGNVLQLAVSGGEEVVATVLSHRPDVNCSRNKVALRKALKDYPATRETVNLLLEYGFNLVPADATDSEILFGAVRIGHVELAEQLITWGANVNSRSSTVKPSLTPLHEAAEGGVEEMMGLLIKHGANIKAKCDAGGTPLRSAAVTQNLKAVKALLKHGARFQDDPQLLHAVIEDFDKNEKITEKGKDDLEPMKFFLENGACLNTLNDANDTPLFTAYRYNHIKIMEILLQYGAQMGPDAEKLRKVFSNAVESDALCVVEVLARNCIDIDPLLDGALINAMKSRSNAVVNFFLEAGYPQSDHSDNVAILNEALRTKEQAIVLNVFEFGNLSLSDLARSSMVSILEEEYTENGDEYNPGLVSEMFSLIPQPDFEFRLKKGRAKDLCRRHLIALKVAGLDINRGASLTEYKDQLQYTTPMRKVTLREPYNIQEECEFEVVNMKVKKVGATSVSFYDMLNASIPKLVAYAGNEEIMTGFKNAHWFGSNFPSYGEMIFKRFRKAQYRKQLLNQAMGIFDVWFDHSSSLPLEIKENILGYLSNQRLQFCVNSIRILKNRRVDVGDTSHLE